MACLGSEMGIAPAQVMFLHGSVRLRLLSHLAFRKAVWNL